MELQYQLSDNNYGSPYGSPNHEGRITYLNSEDGESANKVGINSLELELDKINKKIMLNEDSGENDLDRYVSTTTPDVFNSSGPEDLAEEPLVANEQQPLFMMTKSVGSQPSVLYLDPIASN